MIKKNKKKLAKMALACSMALSMTLNAGLPAVQASSSSESYILKTDDGRELTQYSLYEFYDDKVTFTVSPNNRNGYRVDTDGNGTYDLYGSSNNSTFTLKGVSGKDITCLFNLNGQTMYLVMHDISETYKITYNLAGGVNDPSNPTTYNPIKGATLKNPTRKGYTFTGWYNKNLGSPKTNVVISVGTEGDKTYTATWAPTTYSIKYELNGGKNSSQNPTHYNITNGNISLYNPTKEGCKFLGWYSDATFKTKVGYINSQACESYVLYAKWESVTTETPTTQAPTTEKTTQASTTEKTTQTTTTEKTTQVPTTQTPTTEKTTEVPTTQKPTTQTPTTEKTTQAPTTQGPTTEKTTESSTTQTATTTESTTEPSTNSNSGKDGKMPTYKLLKTKYYKKKVKLSIDTSKVKTVKVNGKVVTSGKQLKKDGKYSIEITDVNGDVSTRTYVIDTKKPVIKTKKRSGKVKITVKDANLKSVTVKGKKQKVKNGTTTITLKKKGKYVVKAVDAAGNIKKTTIKVK